MRRILGTLCLAGVGLASFQAVAQQPAVPAERREERREDRREVQRRDDERRVERREEIRENREARDENRLTVREARQGSSDEQIAAMMLACCNNEVQISTFAKDHLRTQEAKDFADRMIRDHQDACDKLHKLAGAWGRDHAADLRPANDVNVVVNGQTPANPPAKAALEIGQARVEITRPARVEGAVPARVAAPAAVANQLDWVSIHQQVAEQNLASFKRELQEYKSKNQADECYIGHQVASHQMMVNELKVLQHYASPSLKGQIEAAIDTAESHLKLAKSTMESIAKNDRK